MRNTVATYRRLLLETAGVTDERLSSHGAVVGEQLERERPDLLAEVEGMASGAGVVVEELLAVNARTELLGGRGAGECSLVGRIDGAGVRLAQNWDWHPALAASALVWTIAPPGGPWLTTVTEAGMLAKVGVNSRGVAVGLNFLSSTLDGIAGDGVPIHVLLRMVLDSCGSAAEALRLLLGATVSASSCVTVAGSEGDGCALAALELSPAGHGIVWPDARGTLVHTNHFLAEAGRPHEAGVVEDPATLLRLRHLAGALAGGRALEEVLRSHFPQPHAVCRHVDERDPWAERRATLLSVSIDPGAGRLRVTAGPPCERAYEAVERVA